ncbi:MAG: glycosyltransferase family 2 protein [Nocardioides sp.]|nr:glycosyltransferase family 2 protein [Nocardioides sp.]MDO9454947.1 glycosyltransferase family 2 protein [Nocardioides sp.]
MISVLTPSFNYAQFIRMSLDSVRLQDQVDVEHVVMDGASTDETPQILNTYGGLLWNSQSDKGQSDALNKAFSRSSGDWIAWLNADEFYLPGALAALHRRAMQTNADVVFGDFLLADGDAEFQRLVALRELSSFALRNYGTVVPTCSVLIRRSILGEEPWDPELRKVMDWDLWLRLWTQGVKFTYLSQPIGVFLNHGANVTAIATPSDDVEIVGLERKYGVAAIRRFAPVLRFAGNVDHLSRKMLNGSKVRERRAQKYGVGLKLDWMSSPTSLQNVQGAMSKL